MGRESNFYYTEVNAIRQQRKDGMSNLRSLTETVAMSIIKLKQDKMLAEKKRLETSKQLNKEKEVRNVLDAASENYRIEITTLRNDVKQLTEVAAKLKETDCSLTSETSMLKFALGNMDSDRDQLKRTIDDGLKEKTEMIEELARLKQEIIESKEKHRNDFEKEENHKIQLQTNIEEKNANTVKLKIQLIKVREMATNKDSEIQRLKEELCNALRDLDAKKLERKEEMKELSELKEINDKKNAELSSLKTKVSMLEGVNQSLSDITAAKDAVEKEVQRLNDELLKCKTKKRWIAKEHAGNIEELRKCRQRLESMQKKIDTLSTEKLSQGELIGELKDNVVERDRWLADEQKKNDLQRMRFKEKEKSNKNTIEKLHDEIDACRVEIKDKSREVLCLREKQIESYINHRDFEQWKKQQLINSANNI